jgi:cytochrome b involved in lipid metabolism
VVLCDGVNEEECVWKMASQLYRREEVAEKSNSEGAWIVIHNSVYNVTEFLNEVSRIPLLQ